MCICLVVVNTFNICGRGRNEPPKNTRKDAVDRERFRKTKMRFKIPNRNVDDQTKIVQKTK